MNKLRRITLGVALAATLTCGATASAKSGDNTRKQRRTLTGTVLRVDVRAGTLEVRDQATGRVVKVIVPGDTLLRVNIGSQPVVTIERVTPGMTLRDVVVE
jgi:hypothetical protein